MLGLFASLWRPLRQKRGETLDLKWVTARAFSKQWYPQGIDIGTWQGARTLAVSWFRKSKADEHLASRVTFIDLERSRHLDVSLAIVDADGVVTPAQIHVGGIAWFGDRLFVAATGQGVWEFDLSDVRRMRGRTARRVIGSTGWGIGAVARVAIRTQVHPVDLRCSFLGRGFDAKGEPLQRVLIGEYRRDDLGRVGEFSLTDVSDRNFSQESVITPSIARMQGAVRWGNRTFVSQSNGLAKPGALWIGEGDSFSRSDVDLPVGCEDLALDPEGRMLWALGEYPWKRVVRGIPFDALGV